MQKDRGSALVSASSRGMPWRLHVLQALALKRGINRFASPSSVLKKIAADVQIHTARWKKQVLLEHVGIRRVAMPRDRAFVIFRQVPGRPVVGEARAVLSFVSVNIRTAPAISSR